MARASIEQKAIGLLDAFERAGKIVGRVTIEGQKIELVLSKPDDVVDEYAGVVMRHGKT